MRACRTSLVTKAGKSFIQPHFDILGQNDFFFTLFLFRVETSSPIMPRMEAVSVALSSLVRVVFHSGCLRICRTLPRFFLSAMTKSRKDKGLYLNV